MCKSQILASQMTTLERRMKLNRSMLKRRILTIFRLEMRKELPHLTLQRMPLPFHTWTDLKQIMESKALFLIKALGRTSLTTNRTQSMERPTSTLDIEKRIRSTILRLPSMRVVSHTQVRALLQTMASSMRLEIL